MISNVNVGGLTFDAAYDSGNAARIEQGETPDEFHLWTAPDCAGTVHEKQYKAWFAFTVGGAQRGRYLTFVVHNMNNLGKLFKHDMRPVYRHLPSKPRWSRIPLPTSQTGTMKGDPDFRLTFKHRVECDPVSECIQFAFCFPLTYTDTMARLAYLDALFETPPAAIIAGNGAAIGAANGAGRPAQLKTAHAAPPAPAAASSDAPAAASTPAAASSAPWSAAAVGQEPSLLPPPLAEPMPTWTEDVPDVARAREPAPSAAAPRAPGPRSCSVSKIPRPRARTPAAAVNKAIAMADAVPSAPAAAPPSQERVRVRSAIAAAAPAPAHKAQGAVAARNGGAATVPGTSCSAAVAEAATVADALAAAPARVHAAALEAALGTRADAWPSASRAVSESAAAAAVLYAASLTPSTRPPGIYYHRELLTRSMEGRRIDLLTISGNNGLLEMLEEPITSAEGAMEGTPPACLLPSEGERPRAFVSTKPVFLLTARVHPGETPASHVMDGLLEFLLNTSDPRAHALRERFVFLIVPMINPDGVFRGHYRADTIGQNLNRCYAQATPEAHSSVFAIGRLVRHLHARGRLAFYIDTHGHATKRGCLLFGNALPEFDAMVENVLYAKLVGANCRWFDFGGCVFTERNMYRPDARDGLSKAGSGRVATYKLTGLTHVYTLECSYNTGRLVNRLSPAHVPKGMDKRDLSPPPAPSKSASPKYTPIDWRAVGRSLAVAALDLQDANPCSRIGAPGGGSAKGLLGLRGFIGAWVRTQNKKEAERAAKAKANGAETDGEGGGGGSGGSADEDPDNDEPELRGEEEAGLSDEEEELAPAAAPPRYLPVAIG
jgi:hypothetical protein